MSHSSRGKRASNNPKNLRAGDHQYFMITGEWTEFVTQSPIATLENLNPQPGTMMMRVVKTEFIIYHPLEYCIRMQGERKNYAVIHDKGLTKEMFERMSKLVDELYPDLNQDEKEVKEEVKEAAESPVRELDAEVAHSILE